MDEQRQDGDAGDATRKHSGDASDAKSILATPNPQTGQDVTAAIADKITYSVTVQEAQERFARARRKVPSIRSLQRHCQEGLIKGLRTPVIYDTGSHGEPWFINDASLDAYIKKQPIVVLGDASDASPTKNGDASVAKNQTENREVRQDLPPPLAQPTEQPEGIPVSEILLENARLQERLDGKNDVIKRLEDGHDRDRKDWHSERDFLRTDVTEMRALVRDSTAHADRMLDTFKQIGTRQQEPKVAPDQIIYRPVQKDENSTGETRPT